MTSILKTALDENQGETGSRKMGKSVDLDEEKPMAEIKGLDPYGLLAAIYNAKYIVIFSLNSDVTNILFGINGLQALYLLCATYM